MQKIQYFFKETLWQQQATPDATKQHSLFIHYLYNYLKIATLSLHGFIKDHGTLRASALTLYTLLSIVPVIAMCFGIAKGFGFEKTLELYLLEQVPDQDTMVLQLIDMARNMLDTTKGGLVAGFGVAILFWTVIKVISNIEESFNHIWKIEKSRSASRKVSDYLSLMLFAPVLMIVANSINVMVQVKLTQLIHAIALPGTLFALQLLSYLPIIILWGLFSFIFIFMPNTSVNYRSGFFAGIIAGTIYYSLQTLYVSLQVGVSSYNAIYGSFAALPLFLVWLQIAWVIVLFGSELSYFHQNLAFHQFNQKFKHLNFSSKKSVALQMMQHIISQFKTTEQPAYTAEALSLKCNTPISIIQRSLNDLVHCNLLITTQPSSDTSLAYIPSRSTDLLTPDLIIEALENNGESYTISATPLKTQ